MQVVSRNSAINSMCSEELLEAILINLFAIWSGGIDCDHKGSGLVHLECSVIVLIVLSEEFGEILSEFCGGVDCVICHLDH